MFLAMEIAIEAGMALKNNQTSQQIHLLFILLLFYFIVQPFYLSADNTEGNT